MFTRSSVTPEELWTSNPKISNGILNGRPITRLQRLAFALVLSCCLENQITLTEARGKIVKINRLFWFGQPHNIKPTEKPVIKMDCQLCEGREWMSCILFFIVLVSVAQSCIKLVKSSACKWARSNPFVFWFTFLKSGVYGRGIAGWIQTSENQLISYTNDC